MNDQQREAEIRTAGAVMSLHVGLAEVDPLSYRAHMAAAVEANQRMSALIRSRSPEYVRSLEVARGLV